MTPIPSRRNYKILGVSRFETEEQDNENSNEYIGDAHTVDEQFRTANGALQIVLDGIATGYNEFEIVVRGRKNK